MRLLTMNSSTLAKAQHGIALLEGILEALSLTVGDIGSALRGCN